MKKRDITKAVAGEKPGSGIYKCARCGYFAVLNSDDDTLERCPLCKDTEFKSVYYAETGKSVNHDHGYNCIHG